MFYEERIIELLFSLREGIKTRKIDLDEIKNQM